MGALDMIQSGVGGILGMMAGDHENRQQVKQQRKLQALNIEGQKEMSEFNREQAMKMWNDTNYSAQREQMEKAGLNIGLMYGMGGGGGATTESNAGQAPSSPATGRTTKATEGMQMALTQAMTEAQIELAKSQANKNNVEAENAGTVGKELTIAQTKKALEEAGVPQWQIADIVKGMALKEAQTTKAGTETKAIETKLPLEMKKLESETELNVTRQIGEAIDNEWKSELNRAELNKLEAEVYNLYQSVKQRWQGLTNDQKRIEIQKFSEEIKAEYPNIGNVAGGSVNALIRLVNNLTGADITREHNKQKVDN